MVTEPRLKRIAFSMRLPEAKPRMSRIEFCKKTGGEFFHLQNLQTSFYKCNFLARAPNSTWVTRRIALRFAFHWSRFFAILQKIAIALIDRLKFVDQISIALRSLEDSFYRFGAWNFFDLLASDATESMAREIRISRFSAD